MLPFTLETPDGVVLGAWHVLPNTVYDTYVRTHSVPTSGALPQEVFDAALLQVPPSPLLLAQLTRLDVQVSPEYRILPRERSYSSSE